MPTPTPTATLRPTRTPTPAAQWETYENTDFRYEVNVPTSWRRNVKDGGRIAWLHSEDYNLSINVFVPDYRVLDAKNRLKAFIESQTESNHFYEADEPENYSHGNLYGASYTARSQWRADSCIDDTEEYLLTKDGSFYWWISVSACGYSDDKVMWEVFDSFKLY